jgi:hypothetical protein
VAANVGLQDLTQREGGRVGPRVSRGDPSGRDLVESFWNFRDRDHTIAVPWSVPAFHFAHASVGPRLSDNGCHPLPPRVGKGTAYDTVTGIVWCRWLRVGKDCWVTRTDLARSGCYWDGQVQGQATTPSLSVEAQPGQTCGQSARALAADFAESETRSGSKDSDPLNNHFLRPPC